MSRPFSRHSGDADKERGGMRDSADKAYLGPGSEVPVPKKEKSNTAKIRSDESVCLYFSLEEQREIKQERTILSRFSRFHPL